MLAAASCCHKPMTIAALWNSDGQFSGNSAHKDHREYCKILRWWIGGVGSMIASCREFGGQLTRFS